MERQVFHSWGQTAFLSSCLAVFLLIAIGMLTDSQALPQGDVASIVLFSAVAVGALVGLWLAFRMGVVVDARGVHLRAFGRGQRIPWPEIIDISCEEYERRLGLFPLYAPVLKVASGTDYEFVPLTSIGSYQRSVADRRTQLLASRRPTGRRPKE